MASDTISKSDLNLIPYLDAEALGTRTLNLMPMWDGNAWHMWANTAKGLIPIRIVDALDVSYVARSPASEFDVLIPFVELMWQHLSWQPVCPKITAISRDFSNFGTSIEKLYHFYEQRDSLGLATQDFVKTELEYIFILSRSIFDLLQETFSWIWANAVQLSDPKLEAIRKQRPMPETFSKATLENKSDIKSAEALVEKHAISETLARAYTSSAKFFISVRTIRDSIVHSGKDIDTVFVGDRGFLISKTDRTFRELPIWKPEHDENENLRSLLPVVAYVVLGTIETCNNLMLAFAQTIQMPRPIAPGYRIFLRGPQMEALLWMTEIANGGSPWCLDRMEQRLRRIRERAYFLWKNQTGARWWDASSNWRQAERELRFGKG